MSVEEKILEQDLLFEIGTEELPAKSLQLFRDELNARIIDQLQKKNVSPAIPKTECYATPRRLAIIVKNLPVRGEIWGAPKSLPFNIAYDSEGKFTQAAYGFAKKCGVDISELQQEGERLVFNEHIKFETKLLLPEICQNAIANIPIPKPMRWGNGEFAFIRPIHWIVLLFGEEVIETEMFGIKTGRKTYGHRFLAPQAIELKSSEEYMTKLINPGMVIADFDKRREKIKEQINKKAQENNATSPIDEALLDEVTGLVEWPVALVANFEEEFLSVPKESLISSMKTHQKTFPLLDKNEKLLPKFIIISNIESKNPEQVIKGNERVMRARLSDAAFFYHNDCKHTLENFLERLKGVTFQNKLGTVYQQAERISTLAEFIAAQIGGDPKIAARAGLLAKADLTSEMVNEFPELQGIMGYYYALNDNLPESVAIAIREHYQPKFSGDTLPQSLEACAVALAERLDKLVGIFGINQAPTGDKDPFALRRAAIGVIRICCEKKLDLDLVALLSQATLPYKDVLANKDVVMQVKEFLFERLRSIYLESEDMIDAYVLSAVLALNLTSPFDINSRLFAVAKFRNLPEAIALAAANKRVKNILSKESFSLENASIDSSLFTENAEIELAKFLSEKSVVIKPLYDAKNYAAVLQELATLRDPIDRFFEEVMVMVDEPKIRNNRLALLMSLRNLFLQVADISYLQGS